MQKRVLLTGSNGLLGQKIVQRLAKRGNIQLIATSRDLNRHPLREGYTFHQVDLTDKEDLENLFDSYQPTDILHTAAITNVDYCEDHRDECDAVNIEAVDTLVHLAHKHSSRLVHISTDFIFDGTAGPYKETDEPNPVNYYGQSKLAAESLIIKSGIPCAILRTMLLYGVTPSLSRSNIVLWARQQLLAGNSIRVVGDQQRCPTLVEDLADATITAMMKEAEGTYHISGAEMMSIVELVRRLANYWKADPELVSEITSEALGQRAMRPPVTGFIIMKAQTELGYRPHPLEQGLALVDRQLKEYATV